MFKKISFFIGILFLLALTSCKKEKTPEQYADSFFELVAHYSEGDVSANDFMKQITDMREEIREMEQKHPGFEDEFNQIMNNRFQTNPVFSGMMDFGDSGEYLNNEYCD